MSRISITIQGNRLAAEYDYITSGNVETVSCEFVFDESWDGFSKTAVFFQAVEHPLRYVLGTDGTECLVPWEALSENKPLRIGVYGTQGTERKTTSFGTVTLVEGSYNDGTAPPDPTPDIYAQLLDLVEVYRQDNAENADRAETAAGQAEQFKLAALGAAGNALQQATEAEQSAADALELKNIAAQAAGAAEGHMNNAAGYADQAANNILNGVNTHNESEAAHADIREEIRQAEAIARGRATGYVFDTLEDMQLWLGIPENVANLVTGDNLYIRATDVKDYWWDGTEPQELEAECPDLTNYYTKTQTDAMMPILISRTDYDALVASGTVESGRIYDIYEV